MEASLAVIQFLANSPNRVQVFAELVDGPATRRDLQAAVEASRSTVARILDEAADRRWVETDESQYRLTRLGEKMVTDFLTYLETIEGREHLGDMANYLPPPIFSLDFRHFQDARITKQTVDNPIAPVSRALKLLTEAETYRGLNNTGLPVIEEALRDGALTRDLYFEQIVNSSLAEAVRNDPERAAVWREAKDYMWDVEKEHCYWEYDGIIPINTQIIDGTVLVWLGSKPGEAIGLLESENSTVLDWCESLYQDFRNKSEPMNTI